MSAPLVVADTSPLQYLHQVGLLHLLPALFGEVCIPQAVAQELAVGRASGVSLPDPAALGWVTVAEVAARRLLPIAADLGPGEREAIALALQHDGALVLLDDRQARLHAALLGLEVTGTLGVLVASKRAGLVTAVAPVLDRLTSLSFRLADLVRAEVLRLTEEM